MRCGRWSCASALTGDTKLVQSIGHAKTQLASLLKQTRDKSEEKKLHELVDGLSAVIKRFLDVTDEFGQDRGPEAPRSSPTAR